MSLLVIFMLLLDIHVTLAFLYLASPTFQLWVFLNVHFISPQVSWFYLVKLFLEVFWHPASSSSVSFQDTIPTKISFQAAPDWSSGTMLACMPCWIMFPLPLCQKWSIHEADRLNPLVSSSSTKFPHCPNCNRNPTYRPRLRRVFFRRLGILLSQSKEYLSETSRKLWSWIFHHL